MKKQIFILSLFLIFLGCYAQKIKLNEANVQHWTGGVCCISGDNYTIQLEIADTLNFIVIDTIWIGNKFYIENGDKQFTAEKLISEGKTIYNIKVSESTNTKNKGYPEMEVVEKQSSTYPPNYNGQACVYYYLKNKRQIIEIDSFIQLPRLAYP